MLRSLAVFVIGVARNWLWLIPGVLLGLYSLYGHVADNEISVSSHAVWIVIGAGLAIAIIAEYHRVRREREMLAANPRAKLNERLREGYRLKERLLKKKLSSDEDPVGHVVTWLITTGATIQHYAPGYYEKWTRAVKNDDPLAKQLVSGLPVLAEICREVGVP